LSEQDGRHSLHAACDVARRIVQMKKAADKLLADLNRIAGAVPHHGAPPG
jgi:hypothetical protein